MTAPQPGVESAIKPCHHCDFASGYRGMDRCHVCDGAGRVLWIGGRCVGPAPEGEAT